VCVFVCVCVCVCSYFYFLKEDFEDEDEAALDGFEEFFPNFSPPLPPTRTAVERVGPPPVTAHFLPPVSVMRVCGCVLCVQFA